MQSIQEVDPGWAWSEFEPTKKTPWNREAAAHLYRRAGFGATTQQLEEAISKSPLDCVAAMFATDERTSEFEDEANTLARTILGGGDPKQLAAAWTHRLLRTPNQLLEKTTLFWHGHFATGAEKVADADMMWQQNQLLRQYALGKFAPMTQGIAQDPAMLVYLDSVTNRKSHPNENFARELMELFCLGEGNYTEKDVQELARCFTGWEIKRDRFRKNRYQHDTGEKHVLGQRGNFDGEDGVRIVLEQPAMPRFIVSKLVRYFMFDEPVLPTKLTEPLARELRENDLEIGPTVRRILNSNLFFSPHSIARKVRSPIEMMIGLLRSLKATTNVSDLAEGLTSLGHGLFYPPNVKGWDGGRTWINSSTLLGRANLVRKVLTHEKTRFAGEDLLTVAKSNSVEGERETIAWLQELLFAVPVANETVDGLVRLMKKSKQEANERLIELILAMSTLPEFHLS